MLAAPRWVFRWANHFHSSIDHPDPGVGSNAHSFNISKHQGISKIPARQQRVFVVDDEGLIAFTLAAILEQSGFVAVAFTNPLEALRAAQAEPPDLLISDIVMPELSGLDLGLQLHAICPNCKIIFFSAQAASASLLDLVRGNDHSFDFLMKPVHPTDLLHAIRNLWVSDSRLSSTS